MKYVITIFYAGTSAISQMGRAYLPSHSLPSSYSPGPEFMSKSRGKSLITRAYEISDKTIEFYTDFYENKRISCESVRDFK